MPFDVTLDPHVTTARPFPATVIPHVTWLTLSRCRLPSGEGDEEVSERRSVRRPRGGQAWAVSTASPRLPRQVRHHAGPRAGGRPRPRGRPPAPAGGPAPPSGDGGPGRHGRARGRVHGLLGHRLFQVRPRQQPQDPLLVVAAVAGCAVEHPQGPGEASDDRTGPVARPRATTRRPRGAPPASGFGLRRSCRPVEVDPSICRYIFVCMKPYTSLNSCPTYLWTAGASSATT